MIPISGKIFVRSAHFPQIFHSRRKLSGLDRCSTGNRRPDSIPATGPITHSEQYSMQATTIQFVLQRLRCSDGHRPAATPLICNVRKERPNRAAWRSVCGRPNTRGRSGTQRPAGGNWERTPPTLTAVKCVKVKCWCKISKQQRC